MMARLAEDENSQNWLRRQGRAAATQLRNLYRVTLR